MHLFRSEEHARRWIGFDPENEEGIRLVADVHALFSRPLFRERLSPDYVLRLRELVRGYHEGLEQIGKGSTSWAEKAPS